MTCPVVSSTRIAAFASVSELVAGATAGAAEAVGKTGGPLAAGVDAGDGDGDGLAKAVTVTIIRSETTTAVILTKNFMEKPPSDLYSLIFMRMGRKIFKIGQKRTGSGDFVLFLKHNLPSLRA